MVKCNECKKEVSSICPKIEGKVICFGCGNKEKVKLVYGDLK